VHRTIHRKAFTPPRLSYPPFSTFPFVRPKRKVEPKKNPSGAWCTCLRQRQALLKITLSLHYLIPIYLCVDRLRNDINGKLISLPMSGFKQGLDSHSDFHYFLRVDAQKRLLFFWLGA
jgi:hypothetical protein